MSNIKLLLAVFSGFVIACVVAYYANFYLGKQMLDYLLGN